LAVVVAEILISAEEPQAIALYRPSEIGREITIADTFKSAERLSARHREQHRLAGQTGRLAIVGSVVGKAVATRSGNDIENRALNVAVFGGCSNSLDLQFLNYIDAGFGARHALAGACEVCAIDEKQVLVDAGTERRDRVDRTAGRRCG